MKYRTERIANLRLSRYYCLLYISFFCLIWIGGDVTVSSACSVPSLPATYVNVQDYGANPDNPDDDTDSINSAINATPVGGTLYFPPGEYLVRPGGVSVPGLVFHSNMTVFLHTDAVLKEKAGSWANNDFRWLLGLHQVNNVTITGGTVQGVRTGYGTAEVSGHNILIYNSQDISVINVTTIDSPADGINISGEIDKAISEGITLCGVKSDNNRRHGLSVIHARDVLVDNSIFSNSNGSSISSGIDLEPNTFGTLVGSVTKVVINNCQVLNNNGNGIQLHGTNGTVTGNTLRYNKVLGNLARGVRITDVAANILYKNLFEVNGEDVSRENGLAVLRLENSYNIRIEKNTIRDGVVDQPGIRFAGAGNGSVIIDNDICVDHIYGAIVEDFNNPFTGTYSESLTTYCTRTPHLGNIQNPTSGQALPFVMLLLGN